jgi:lipopolysaccharide transport system ATP-binding protein
MNADIAIRVTNLGKKYNLGAPREKYHTLGDAIVNFLQAPSNFFHRVPQNEGFWALKEVSFDVEQGDVVGVIGRNGAGKSTLLKILSRITTPTEGTIELHGRVGSLLEVGTGFHPEMTGRENIFLNGSILGMKKIDIEQKFDEIIKFSEIEKFLDTPVKRYSSGMYVRLAFAVAAHMEPEILVVDEVLAVGDAVFQKKCLGKMGDIAQEGRTVLFVSHNMGAVSNLCSKGVLLNAGRIDYIGDVKSTLEKYTSKSNYCTSFDLTVSTHEDRPRKYVLLTRLSIMNEKMEPAYSFHMGDSIIARISLICLNRMENAEIGLKITSIHGINIHYFSSTWEGLTVDLDRGEYTFELTIPKILLYPGKYYLNCWVTKSRQASDDIVFEIGLIEILSKDITGYAPTFDLYAVSGCEVYSPSKWKIIMPPKY